jgi:hypothetical protein
MMITSLPFFFYEMLMGYIKKKYLDALLVVLPSKTIGLLICFGISR